ncbi:unnamed protein product [Scytosiphon promiscuus]
MSSRRDVDAGGDEEDVTPEGRARHMVDDGEEEEEPVAKVHSLEGVTWRDMKVGQESARDVFERLQRHGWPAMPAFSFGGVLGGEATISDAINNASGNDDGSSGGGGCGGVAKTWWRSFARSPGGVRRLWMVMGGVLLAVLVAVALSGGSEGGGVEGKKSPLSAGTPRHDSSAASSALLSPRSGGGGGGDGDGVVAAAGAYAGPSPLRKRLRSVADTALAAGITLPMHTTFEVVRAPGDGGRASEGVEEGMDFIVSVISGGALEAKAAVATPPTSAASSDPFDPRVLDSRMIVEELPPSHSLVLNKFNTMRNHALIITKEFQSQEAALTETDFSAWYRVVEQLPGVGFYNSAVEAGASQRHKHMQVIPDDALWDYRPTAEEAIPVDEPISRLVGSSRDVSKVWKLPEFRFQHAFTLLPSPEELADEGAGAAGDDPAQRMAAHLRERYVQLLREVGFDTSSLSGQPENAPGDATGASDKVPVSSLPPYNAVLTTRWLMVVPRSRREWGGIDVNGMGFLGALLVREKALEGEGAGVGAVREPGALAVLEGVTFGGGGGESR